MTPHPFHPFCPHEWEAIRMIRRAEISRTDPLAHTSFMLIGCRACRTVDAFPASNAALCTPAYVEVLRQELAAEGWILPEGITWGPRPS